MCLIVVSVCTIVKLWPCAAMWQCVYYCAELRMLCYVYRMIGVILYALSCCGRYCVIQHSCCNTNKTIIIIEGEADRRRFWVITVMGIFRLAPNRVLAPSGDLEQALHHWCCVIYVLACESAPLVHQPVVFRRRVCGPEAFQLIGIVFSCSVLNILCTCY